MKKTITVMTLLAGAVSVYSQGTVGINDYNSKFQIQVFQPQTTGFNYTVTYGGYTVSEETGNTSNSYNPAAGTTVYANTALLGTGYDVQLLAGSTGGLNLSQLSPVGSVVTQWTQSPPANAAALGTWSTGAVDTIPGASATSATFAVAAWQATGISGAATTLAEAQADGYKWGISAVATGSVLNGAGTPPALPTGITDFAIGQSVPEPSTIALGVMGASAFLFRRRK